MAGLSQKGVYLFLLILTATLLGFANSWKGDEKLQGKDLVKSGGICDDLVGGTGEPQQKFGDLKKYIEEWQGVVLLICFGAFALFIVLIHRIVRWVGLDLSTDVPTIEYIICIYEGENNQVQE